MKKSTLFILSFSTLALASCSDTISNDCWLTEESCQTNKTFDADKCECVDKNIPCGLTEESCQSVNKILDADKCICVENTNPDCQITQAQCDSDNKILDAENCTCIPKTDTVTCTMDDVTLNVGDKACDKDGLVVTCQMDGSMSAGEQCTEGICDKGECVDRDCGDIQNGTNICIDGVLMFCRDGELEKADPGCDETSICRDGQTKCSPYFNCDAIAHNANGCLDGNVVACDDGTTSLLKDCVSDDQFCAPNDESEFGFDCKSPDPTDCAWNGGLVEKGQNVCDGNVLKTCSAQVDTQFDDGTDCIELDPDKPICDTNICREERFCGNEAEIAPGTIACNEDGSNKAECVDGKLVDLTGDDACPSVANAMTLCVFDTEATCDFACNNGYIEIDNACQPIATCDASKEIYNAATNTCSCNTAGNWTGTAGACTCKTGYYQDGTTCKLDDAQHCRGVDCTAVSYWGDGYCTADGQCQVTTCTGDTHPYNNGTKLTCEANSADNCGSHGSACEDGKACVNGACACGEGMTSCFGTCVDLQTDIDNCGACDNLCATGLACVKGKCIGKTNCEGVSVDTRTNLNHCGQCKNRCDDGKTCIAGECIVADGPTYCGSKTVQLGTPQYCNSCEPCADGLICANNQCVTGQGKMICNNIVVDSRTDSANCGSCGKVCGAGLQCVDSRCTRIDTMTSSTTITCNAKTVTPYTDRENCSGCNIACSAGYQCRLGACVESSVGETFTFGHYEQDNNTSNGKEPITWRVLAKSSGKYLIISEKALDVVPYNTTYISITWEKSTIRSWLNGYGSSYNTVGTSYTSSNFINTAFTAEERSKIVTSTVPAHTNPSYPSVSPGNATQDKIFLLSVTEAQQYFTTNTARQVDATRYVVKKGAYVIGSKSGKYTSDGTCTDVHCYSLWWLRSPGSISNYAAGVNNGGAFYSNIVNLYRVAVRPALWVNF